jgi:hypothetical protein
MRHAVAAELIAGALLAVPAIATAGAPNYDCRIAGGGRIAIDQWAAIITASGFEHKPSIWGTAASIRQNGPSLDLQAKMDGATWKIAVRGTGSSLAITRPAGNLAGRCAFIPGNYVLRRTNRGGYTMRAAPSDQAKLLARIPLGSPIWQDPNRTPHASWMPVRTTVIRNGTLQSLDGWLRQMRIEPIFINRSASN